MQQGSPQCRDRAHCRASCTTAAWLRAAGLEPLPTQDNPGGDRKARPRSSAHVTWIGDDGSSTRLLKAEVVGMLKLLCSSGRGRAGNPRTPACNALWVRLLTACCCVLPTPCPHLALLYGAAGTACHLCMHSTAAVALHGQQGPLPPARPPALPHAPALSSSSSSSSTISSCACGSSPSWSSKSSSPSSTHPCAAGRAGRSNECRAELSWGPAQRAATARSQCPGRHYGRAPLHRRPPPMARAPNSEEHGRFYPKLQQRAAQTCGGTRAPRSAQRLGRGHLLRAAAPPPRRSAACPITLLRM